MSRIVDNAIGERAGGWHARIHAVVRARCAGGGGEHRDWKGEGSLFLPLSFSTGNKFRTIKIQES